MTKIVAWLIVIFVVLLALRMIGVHNARKRARATASAKAKSLAEPMVRCLRCGIFMPRSEARQVDGGYACASGSCAPKG